MNNLISPASFKHIEKTEESSEEDPEQEKEDIAGRFLLLSLILDPLLSTLYLVAFAWPMAKRS